ncbi:hypothetical protein LINGRAHAP2_LOCUS9478 [Linum grandiflorum]
MVYISGEGDEPVRRRRDGAAMAAAMRTERSKPPLHNFNLPCLKWGNQRHLRCMKVSDSTHGGSNNPRNGGISFSASDRHHRRNRSPPSKFTATAAAASRNCDARPHHHHSQFKKPNPVVGGGADDEGIDAVRKKIMLDLKTAAYRMKQEILRKDVGVEEDEDEEAEQGRREERRRSSPPAAVTGDADKHNEPRPWNLRTRRAACKAPPPAAPIGTSPATGKGLKIEDRKENSCSPIRNKREREVEDEEEERPEKKRAKFSVSLSKKEIENDFMAMLGHRPARRPKKRPRIVQKQIDALSIGFWLGEINVDTYKVPEEIADTGKR